MLAQSSGASEIGIEHLLTALDYEAGFTDPVAPLEGPFVSVPKQDMLLLPGAAEAIAPLGDIWRITLDVLRGALVSAKRQSAH